ncbi:MAG: MlaD family protein [Vicinamibacterales bacterium]
MEARRSAWVGAFVVAGAALFAVGLFLIGDRRMLFVDHIELGATFGRVTGVQVGTPVRLAGLGAGEVREIRLPSRPSEPFLVRMRVRQDLQYLVRADSIAEIQTDGLVGGAFVQLSVGTDDAPAVASGDVLAGLDPIEFADLMRQGRETFAQAGRDVSAITDDVTEALDSLTRIVDTTDDVVAKVGDQVQRVGTAGTRVVEDAAGVVTDVRAIVSGVRAGEGTMGRLFTDTAFYDRLNAIGHDAAESARSVKDAAEITKTAVRDFVAADGAGPQMAQSVRSTLAGIEEVTSDLAEGTEALKRNILFRGFFQSRGFYDLDAISREAYQAGLLERDNRTAVRVWLDADVLFGADAAGAERLTEEGRRRIDSAMSQLVQYPRDSPLIVEGYARTADEASAFLTSVARSTLVRDYVLSRFRRQSTLTDVMPLGNAAAGSPSGDGRWGGVALTMFVENGVFRRQRDR